MCATIRSLPFTTGAKPIFLSGFNRRARTGSHRKNLIFAPCAAYHGVFYACTFGGFCAILQKTARLSHTVLLSQLIPARGRKLKKLESMLQHSCRSQLIPARGRLLLVSQQPFTFLSQLIPVRGQKKPFPKKRKGLSPVYITAKK